MTSKSEASPKSPAESLIENITKERDFESQFPHDAQARAKVDAFNQSIALVCRHYEGHPAVAGKPLEFQSRDELLAYIRRQEADQLQEVENLQDEIVRLDKLVYVPGLWKCAKCKCQVVSNHLHASTGNITANNSPQQCPNDCGPMWRVTERDAGNELIDRMEAAAAIAPVSAETVQPITPASEQIEILDKAIRKYHPELSEKRAFAGEIYREFMGDASTRKDEGAQTGGNTVSAAPLTSPAKTSWTCPDYRMNPCDCQIMGAATPDGVLSREEDRQKTCPAPTNTEQVQLDSKLNLSSEILDNSDVKALLGAYDLAKELGRSLTAIQGNIDIVRKLLVITPEPLGSLPDDITDQMQAAYNASPGYYERDNKTHFRNLSKKQRWNLVLDVLQPYLRSPEPVSLDEVRNRLGRAFLMGDYTIEQVLEAAGVKYVE